MIVELGSVTAKTLGSIHVVIEADCLNVGPDTKCPS